VQQYTSHTYNKETNVRQIFLKSLGAAAISLALMGSAVADVNVGVIFS
jgi:hypothetical protein